MRPAERLYLKRKFNNLLALVLSCLATLFGIIFLLAILWTLVSNGLPFINSTLFTQQTPPPGQVGGLINAIYGSLIMTTLGTLFGTPIGILAGIYLAETGGKSRLASVVRFVNGILLSAPSVIVGFAVYTVVVARVGHFSAWAGSAALAVILIPVVVNSTENMLKLVPNSLREAAAALGAPRWRVTYNVSYQAAKKGIQTGVLLGIARISGETAPLLFTALNNQFTSFNFFKPMANLPVTIFQFAMSPYDDWRNLAWAGALLITMTVLLLNIIARSVTRKKA